MWDKTRDARLYPGPWPVVAHPPCERWGRYWYGSPSSAVRLQKGDDGGCFAAALAAVRRFGGVLEHPADSAAWGAFDLMPPPRSGGWVVADWLGGWSCCLDQGHYGHRARKMTWLYACRARPLPSLTWGRSDFEEHDDAGRAEARAANAARRGRNVKRSVIERLSKKQRDATPVPFAQLLLSIASSVTS